LRLSLNPSASIGDSFHLTIDGMRVFITGAAGFLGAAMARALAKDGAEVHGLIRCDSDRSALNGVAVHWHVGDVTEPKTLAGAFNGMSWIIHSAGLLGKAGLSEELYRKVNVEGTRNVMQEALATAPWPRVLDVSSSGISGTTSREPVAEDAGIAPTNPYERSKAAAEQIACEFAARGLPVVIARPGFIYGPGDRHVLKLFQAVLRGQFFYVGGGRCLSHPTFIDDAVNGMLLCLRRGRTGEPYHITGPRPVTFRELGETIAGALGVRQPWITVPEWTAMLGATGLETLGRIVGQTPPLSRTGVSFFSRDRVFSWQKAHQELGYTPRRDLAPGVTITVAWYRQHGWL
jgi:nucleoside-diphosphate-sugar epimerase